MKATNKRWTFLGESVSAVTMTLLNCLQHFDMKRDAARKTSPGSGPRRLGMRIEERQPTPQSAQPTEPMQPIRIARFSGTVIRSGERFALRDVDGCLYPFDSAGRAWQFEGEDVTVTGNLDTDTQMLHILQIEALAA